MRCPLAPNLRSRRTPVRFGIRTDWSPPRNFFRTCMHNRRVGKGGVLNLYFQIPVCQTDFHLDDCIRCYDERTDNRGTDFAGQGVSARHSDLVAISRDADLIDTMRVVRRCQPFRMPAPIPASGGQMITAEVLTRFVLTGSGARQFLHPYGRQEERPTYLQNIEPLISVLVLFPLLAVRFLGALSTVLRFGHALIHEQSVSKAFDELLPRVVPQLKAIRSDVEWSGSYREWRQRIDALEPSAWPLEHGGVVRQQNAVVLIDLAAASYALLSRTTIDRRDSVSANIRSLAFELQVQSEIDKSTWAPGRSLAELRGRPLRRNGKAITDLDAIGAKNRTLLAASCKSVIYDREYDKGSHRVIRAMSETVDAAVAHWRNIVMDLFEHPLGDNFDFSQYDRIVAVV